MRMTKGMKTPMLIVVMAMVLLPAIGRSDSVRPEDVGSARTTAGPAQEIAGVAANVVTVKRFQRASRPVQIAYVGGMVEMLNLLGLICPESPPVVAEMIGFLRESRGASNATFSAPAVMEQLHTQGCYFAQDGTSRQIRELFRPPTPRMIDTDVALR